MFREGFRFLGLPGDLSGWEASRYVILSAPYDGTTSYNAGTREAPRAIVGASLQVELYDGETGRDASRAGIHTLPEIEPDLSGPRATLDRIRDAARTIIDAGKIPVTLGGEHTVSNGPVEALLDSGHYPGLSILQIDAHADLREAYEGTPWNHACVMRRFHERALPLVQVGVRAVSEEEHVFMRAVGLSDEFFAWNLQRNGWRPERIVEALGNPVYVSIDVDGFDPSVFPGTGTPEPGGLSWTQGLELLRRVAACRRVVGFDVVETIPTPPLHACEFAAARLVYKMIGYLEAARG